MSEPTSPAPTRAATLADVGRAVGVSPMAVSAVLNAINTSSRTSPATRARILEAAARLRYRPNVAARGLLQRRMNTIGIAAILDEGEFNHYFLALFTGVLSAAKRFGQNTTIFALRDWSGDMQRLDTICDGRIDGLILFAPTLDPAMAEALPKHTPFVTVHANVLLPGSVNIESDEARGAFAMVEHLVAQGHRRIMHIAGPTGFKGAERRAAGYRQVLAAHDLPFDSSLLVHSLFDHASGRQAMMRWLETRVGEPLPHAVFCANDAIALGAMEALAEWGLRVPDDISLCGFDDTIASRAAVPRLTTVRQPLMEMGCLAAEVLLAEIGTFREGDVPSSPVVMPVELVVRESVGPLRVENRPVPDRPGR